jgi:tripartite-type tricarboxylate transporter receptor subunit TctC
MARLRFLVRSLARSAPLMLAFALGAGQAAAQAEFPNRRIHVLVPYPAGGIVDIVTRIVADRLAEIWRQPIVVEAKPGANGNIAWDQAARAEPDGYTWVFVGPAIMANPRMYSNLRWSEKSFSPVGAVAWAPSVLVVHPSFPAGTVDAFIKYARERPGALNWASPGVGTSQHLSTAMFLNAAKLDMLSIPYAGQPPAILDLMANRVQFKVASIGLVAQHIKSGALKPLAVLGTARSPLLPDVPTVAETGYPESNVVPWYGYAVPRNTPQPILNKIAAGFLEAIRTPKVRELLEKQALEPMDAMTLTELADLYAADTEKYAKVIREAGIKRSE